MVQSMTGYAVASADYSGTSGGVPRALTLELRSVNSRFLDLQFRVAEELRALEPLLRERITARVARGKLDCRLSVSDAANAGAPRLNAEALTRLRRMEEAAAQQFPRAAPLGLADVLRWPGVLAEPPADESALRLALERLLEQALAEFAAARGREGARLAAALHERVAAMRRLLAQVAPLVPEAVAAYRARLAERLRDVMASESEERIRAEAILFAARSDVDEELTRLAAHLDAVDATLKQGGAVGKRLDFLAQELNREANTLAAKAAGLRISDCALELKLLIEQVREQVQNIE
jgi:uncharacterized protein (TIGR00255 family)